MSETVVKLVGLACMIAGIFMILFGMHLPAGAPPVLAPLLVGMGVVALLAGSIIYAVVKPR